MCKGYLKSGFLYRYLPDEVRAALPEPGGGEAMPMSDGGAALPLLDLSGDFRLWPGNDWSLDPTDW